MLGDCLGCSLSLFPNPIQLGVQDLDIQVELVERVRSD